MGCEVALIIAFLCILQCGQYQAENAKNPIIVIRIPKAKNNPPQFQKQNRGYPYYPQFNTGCNSCRSNICGNRCNNNKTNEVSVMLPNNPFWVSLLGANGQRTNVFIDIPKRTESKQVVDVIVTVKNNNQTANNASVATTGNATASKDKNGEQLTADTTADNVNVEVVVQNEGQPPEDTELNSEITDTDGNGDKSDTKTQATIDQTPKDKVPKPPNNPQNTAKPPTPNTSALPNKDPKNPPSEGEPTPNKNPVNPPPSSDPSTPDKVPESPNKDSPATNDPKSDVPKPDEPKPDVPKPDEPKPDEPKPDEPKPDEPKPDEPKPDPPKPDEPKPDAPKPDEPKPDEPKPDEPKPDDPTPKSEPPPSPDTQTNAASKATAGDGGAAAKSEAAGKTSK